MIDWIAETVAADQTECTEPQTTTSEKNVPLLWERAIFSKPACPLLGLPSASSAATTRKQQLPLESFKSHGSNGRHGRFRGKKSRDTIYFLGSQRYIQIFEVSSGRDLIAKMLNKVSLFFAVSEGDRSLVAAAARPSITGGLG